MKYIYTLLFVAFLLYPTTVNSQDIKTIKENYKKLLLFDGEQDLIKELTKEPKEQYFSDQMVVELMERYPSTSEDIRILLDKRLPNGSWNDIPYDSQERSGWKPRIHVDRILQMVKVYKSPSHELYQSATLSQAILQSLRFWIDTPSVCPNWWYNQIGVPKVVGAVAILMEDELTDDDKAGVVRVMNNAKFGMTGQNKVWLAGNVLVRALLEDNPELVKEARDIILSEIVIGLGDKEGIKPDWSYHQHGAQQQFGNYGAAYLATMSFWLKAFDNTEFAASQDQLDVLSQLIENGYQRVLWKGYMDVAGLGRQFFQQTQRHKAFSVTFSANNLSKVDKKNAEKYKALIKENLLDRKSDRNLTGLYHFWKSDQTVQRAPQWMTSVKMSSKRVIGAEGGNGDNLQGFYLGDGATYTYIDGDEYHDIFPCWDWTKIPGITAHESGKALKEISWGGMSNERDFVGNVNDGHFGLSAMDIERDGLLAKKAWIFTPDFTLCIGAGIVSDSVCKVTTSVEQNKKKTDLLYLNKNKWMPIAGSAFIDTDVQRYHHNSTGYIVLGNGKTTAISEKRKHSWSEVMDTYPKDEVSEKEIVSLSINHGVQPRNAVYQYLILPQKTQQEIAKFDLNEIKIIRNDSISQVVNLPSQNKVFVVSYAPVDIELEGGMRFKTSDAGLFLLSYENKKWEILVSDPTRKLETMIIHLGNKNIDVNLPNGEDKGTSVKVVY